MASFRPLLESSSLIMSAICGIEFFGAVTMIDEVRGSGTASTRPVFFIWSLLLAAEVVLPPWPTGPPGVENGVIGVRLPRLEAVGSGNNWASWSAVCDTSALARRNTRSSVAPTSLDVPGAACARAPVATGGGTVTGIGADHVIAPSAVVGVEPSSANSIALGKTMAVPVGLAAGGVASAGLAVGWPPLRA